MPIVSICFFVITGALLIYAGLTAISKKIIVLPTMSASVKHVTKKYATRFAILIAFLSISPFIAAILGLFIEIVIIPIIVFFVLFVLLLIIGIKIIMKDIK